MHVGVIMKILIICNSALGLYSFREQLIKKLINKEHTVSVVLPMSTESVELKAEEQIRNLGCTLYHIKMERRSMNPLLDIKLLFGYNTIIKKSKPDYVITYTIKPNIYAGFLCYLKSIPYAVNVTGLGSAFQVNGYLKKFVIGLYRFALKRVRITFFENVENRDIFVRYKIVPTSKTCLLNGAGVDLNRYTYLDYPQDCSETRFLFVGRVMSEKGIQELFKACHALYQDKIKFSLHIVGGCEEDYSNLIKKFTQEGWLYYYGYQMDVRPFIKNCHCVVLPSWHEGMANTNLEAAASGRPVITSNIHGCLEAIQDGVTGYLVKKQDVSDLYRVMKSFTELPYTQRVKMGVLGREHMEQVFDKDEVVERTIEELNL